jgi:hypothetical protein
MDVNIGTDVNMGMDANTCIKICIYMYACTYVWLYLDSIFIIWAICRVTYR